MFLANCQVTTIALSKAKTIAVLQFNQQQDSDRFSKPMKGEEAKTFLLLHRSPVR